MGVERLLITAAESGSAPGAAPACDAVVASLEPGQAQLAAAAARTLRGADVPTVLDVSDRKVDRKLRAADRLGARVCVLIGPDEQAEEAATVRDMRNRQQQRVPLSRLAAAVAEALANQEDTTA